jgi:hypothetical protein
VVRALRGVRETAIRGRVLSITIDAARAPWDLRASHLLNGSNTTKSPEITIRDPWELLLNALHQFTRNVKAGVGAVKRL